MDYEMERQQAIFAGNKALASLEDAKAQLSAARALGIWDLLGGRGLVSFFKHIKINNARESIQRAKYDLQNFNNELRDVSMNLNIDIGDFLTFFDFMDSFLADVFVQSRIADAENRLDRAIREVRSVLSRI